MKKTILLSLLAAAFLTACSSDDPEPQAPKQEEQPSQQEPRLLTVEVSETPLADANGTPNQIKTRTAAATTTASLKEFYLDFKNSSNNEEPYKFEKDDKNVWNSISWPERTSTGATIYNSDKLDFYAYNDGTLNWTSTNPYSDPYVSFTVDPHPTSQTDLLVAKNNVAYNDHGGKVPLTFDHACAAVKFNLIRVTSAGENTIEINSVTLNGVKEQGQYHYNPTGEDPNWQSLSNPVNYTLTDSKITLSDNNTHPLPCGYLFLIPQPKNEITLTVNYGAEKSNTYNLSGTWEAGLEYTINIYIGESFIK